MYISDTDNSRKAARGYLIAAAVIAAAAQVYGLFSHGVSSAFMTFAFAIPLVLGAMPYLTASLIRTSGTEAVGSAIAGFIRRLEAPGLKDTQLAVVVTLTAGSLLKGALDIYGTTNRLLIVYPLLAAALLIAAGIKTVKSAKN